MSLLDERRFPMDHQTGQKLFKVLTTTYLGEGKIRSMVVSAGVDAATIDWHGSSVDMWTDVLEKTAKQARLRDLIEVVRADELSRGFQDLIDELTAADPRFPPGVDVYSLALLPPARAFLDRTQLRENLRSEFATQDGVHVLLVQGQQGLGKSHSWHLISYIGQTTRTYTAYRFDLTDWSGAPRGPQDVFREICEQLRWQPPTLDVTAQPDAVVRILVSTFKGLARGLPERTCLVFDGFTDQTADEWARRLVIGVAAAASDGEAGDVRVVLIGVDTVLTASLADQAVTELLTDPTIDHLTSFFSSAASAAGEHVTADGMAFLIENVLGPAPHPRYLAISAVGPRAAKVAALAFGRRS